MQAARLGRAVPGPAGFRPPPRIGGQARPAPQAIIRANPVVPAVGLAAWGWTPARSSLGTGGGQAGAGLSEVESPCSPPMSPSGEMETYGPLGHVTNEIRVRATAPAFPWPGSVGHGRLTRPGSLPRRGAVACRHEPCPQRPARPVGSRTAIVSCAPRAQLGIPSRPVLAGRAGHPGALRRRCPDQGPRDALRGDGPDAASAPPFSSRQGAPRARLAATRTERAHLVTIV